MTETIDIHEVRPRLRFLLSKEAKEEGKKLANLFSTYSARKDPSRTSSQFSHIIGSIRGGRFPNVARADEVMKGTLIASLQVIVDARRRPEWLMWRQTWANDLADGRPQHMAASANYMIDYEDKLQELLDTSGQQLDADKEKDGVRSFQTGIRSLSDVTDPVLRERLRRKMNDEARLAVFREICPEVVPMILYSMNMTEEEKARERADNEERYLRDYAKNLISEFELVTGEKFDRAWETKKDLHDALRHQFSDYYDEKLSIRTLLLGGYR
ncbi:hypothetical protein [Sinorhizobium fredii]|uniref:hypothetical protein n=1 Tax=Rhizobium fredii TaxID=380 RepID=UPI00129540F7|nr:hypothetical protein [Sinorhizobium fredii]MQW99628.1 hypothetical protein [Sinorhizobium fredii]